MRLVCDIGWWESWWQRNEGGDWGFAFNGSCDWRGHFVSLNVTQGDEVVNSSAETKSQGHWCDSVDLQNCDFAKKLVGKTVVCVGDSWAAGTVTDGVLSSTSDETSWWWHLGRDLSLENVIHKGVGGAGWARHGGIAPGQNFNDELTMLAEAMTPEERSGVGLIIIAGGINDVVSNQTAEGVLRGVGECLDTCDRFFLTLKSICFRCLGLLVCPMRIRQLFWRALSSVLPACGAGLWLRMRDAINGLAGI